MDFDVFLENIEILNSTKGDELRKKYIEQFIDTDHVMYHNQIQIKHKFIDGYCYLGYLWDYIKNPIIIQEASFYSLINKFDKVFVFWDIHTCERILIKDYWKLGKNTMIKLTLETLLCGEAYLPEDIYIFDDSLTWTLVKTHEDINGERYCLRGGNI